MTYRLLPFAPSEWLKMGAGMAHFWSNRIEDGIQTIKDVIPGTEEAAKEWIGSLHRTALIFSLSGMTCENITKWLTDEPPRHTPV